MPSCLGDGSCLPQCFCECFEDEECEVPSVVCSCGHRDHPKLLGGTTEFDIYCKSECTHSCQLVECHNYKMCGKKLPQWLLKIDGGMCSDCAIMFGKIKFLGVKGDCPVCIDNKDMIEISCGKHTVCLDCWKGWSKNPERPAELTCPLCREGIWKWKK